MRRKKNMQHFDQRQIMMLENAYYQVPNGFGSFSIYTNPPSSATRLSVHPAR
jgi:hypothetical protein